MLTVLRRRIRVDPCSLHQEIHAKEGLLIFPHDFRMACISNYYDYKREQSVMDGMGRSLLLVFCIFQGSFLEFLGESSHVPGMLVF